MAVARLPSGCARSQSKAARCNPEPTHKTLSTDIPVSVADELNRISKLTGIKKGMLIQQGLEDKLREVEYLHNRRI